VKKLQSGACADQVKYTGGAASNALNFDGQIVLVFEGGGALGAYQVGVYEALHDAGVEPDWVIGTSIGAINAAIIAGNRPEDRMERLNAFWKLVQARQLPWEQGMPWAQSAMNLNTVMKGVDGFFKPNTMALLNNKAALGTYKAGYYCTDPLGGTLAELVDFERLNDPANTRLSLGAVNVKTGKMRYFDSRDDNISVATVMASGALPPAFPAVEVDGEPYWDGGIYSNTPVETVMNDAPRYNSLIFAAHLWLADGAAPQSVWDAMGRGKDIQFASRVDNYVNEERKLHRLRHVINLLGKQLSPKALQDPAVKEMLAWGCSTTMHLCRLHAPRLAGEDQSKDIDFSESGIRQRREAGYASTMTMLQQRPWLAPHSELEGVVMHDSMPQV
jgi:NTE family protein